MQVHHKYISCKMHNYQVKYNTKTGSTMPISKFKHIHNKADGRQVVHQELKNMQMNK